MGIIQRQATKGSIVSYIGVLLGFFTTVYILPEFFTPEQIGIYRFVLDTGLLVGSFATLGMPNLVLKFFPYLKNPETNHNGFVLYMFLIPFVGFILYASLIIIFDNFFIEYLSKSTLGYDKYFIFILPIALFSALLFTFESYSTVNNRIVVPKFIKEIIIKTFLVGVLLIYLCGYLNFISAIKSLSLVYLIALVALLIYIKILGNPIFPIKSFKFIPKKTSVQMLSFGAFIVFSAVGMGLLSKIDMFVISSELGFAATGIYTTALYIATIIEIPSRSLYQISLPIITNSFKDGNIKNIESIYKKTTQNLIIISGCLLLLLIVNLDNIFYLFPKGDIYSKGKYVVIFIAISKFIDTSIGLNFSILGFSKYYYYSLPLYLLLGISNFFLNYWFIDIWGLTGSAVATTLILVTNNIIVLMIIYVKYKIHPFQLKNVYPLITLLIIFLISHYLINFSNVYFSIFLKSTFILASLGFLTIKYNFSEDISSTYNRYWLFVKNKLKK